MLYKVVIKMREQIIYDATHMFQDVWVWVVGVLVSVLGYFLPIKNIVHLIILFFIIDMLIGYWAARKIKCEKFSVSKIWKTTVPRMLLSITLIIMSYMWDNVYEVTLFSTYSMIGWFITGVVLSSIVKNMYRITKWEVFPQLTNLIKGKISERTGINIAQADGDISKNN